MKLLALILADLHKQAKLFYLRVQKTRTHTLKSGLVTVWCGLWFRGIIEPFFFEKEQGQSMATVV